MGTVRSFVNYTVISRSRRRNSPLYSFPKGGSHIVRRSGWMPYSGSLRYPGGEPTETTQLLTSFIVSTVTCEHAAAVILHAGGVSLLLRALCVYRGRRVRAACLLGSRVSEALQSRKQCNQVSSN